MVRKHSKYCDGIICNGKVSCPTTKKMECGKELNFKVYIDGRKEVISIWCFGCNQQHRITETKELITDIQVNTNKYKGIYIRRFIDIL